MCESRNTEKILQNCQNKIIFIFLFFVGVVGLECFQDLNISGMSAYIIAQTGETLRISLFPP